MKIKDYKCKHCGNDDFFLKSKGNMVGIYCNHCGRYYKWASRDERNFQFSNSSNIKNMTNGEKFEEIFRWSRIDKDNDKNIVNCYIENSKLFMASLDWWNMPFQDKN